MMNEDTESIILGGGCFWCVEAVFQKLHGITKLTSGYMGGSIDAPSYEQICSGATGHAEVVEVTFRPSEVTLQTVLEWFFATHDPTTLNRQGADQGTQYRSVIFYHSPSQKIIADAVIAQLQPHFASPIVTELSEASTFWPAEDYHQNYYQQNSGAIYCQMVIAPKLKKLPPLGIA